MALTLPDRFRNRDRGFETSAGRFWNRGGKAGPYLGGSGIEDVKLGLTSGVLPLGSPAAAADARHVAVILEEPRALPRAGEIAERSVVGLRGAFAPERAPIHPRSDPVDATGRDRHRRIEEHRRPAVLACLPRADRSAQHR